MVTAKAMDSDAVKVSSESRCMCPFTNELSVFPLRVFPSSTLTRRGFPDSLAADDLFVRSARRRTIPIHSMCVGFGMQFRAQGSGERQLEAIYLEQG
jgi:hypothetical protein